MEENKSSKAQLSKVQSASLRTHVIDYFSMQSIKIKEPHNPAATPMDYAAFEWRDSVAELVHKDDSEAGIGYVTHVKRLFPGLKKDMRIYSFLQSFFALSDITIDAEIKVDARPGSFTSLTGRVDLGILGFNMTDGTKSFSEILEPYESDSGLIYVAFELKKPKSYASSVQQAQATLYALDDVTNHFVLVVLTDLQSRWNLFWLAESKNGPGSPCIYQYECSAATAVSMIKEFIQYSINPSSPLPTFPPGTQNFIKLKRIRSNGRMGFLGQSDKGRGGKGGGGNGHGGKGRGKRSALQMDGDGSVGKDDDDDDDDADDDGGADLVDGMELSEEHRQQYEDYLFREFLFTRTPFRHCGLVNVPPPFLLEQDI